jgi:hypothetical protein
MGNLLGGSDKGQKLAKQQAEQQQRRTLADLARQQADSDQSTASRTGRKTGSRMLTFLSGEGLDKFGQA